MMRTVAVAAASAVMAVLAAAAPAAGQQPADRVAGWDGERALELVARARERRSEPVADETLRSYRADATGHVYFFLDREDAGEPVLLRADQVALELYWAQPDRAKQVIRGMRSEEQFPIRDFAYYLDRYTVIQNGFDDEIRVGEGRDVADVPHPLASGAEALYEYRLADSLTIRLPGRGEPLRVYEIQVRPRDFGRPAIVGSLFLERARADLVRLAFTFTPAAYLDPRNERVEVTLENALWEDRYWLPREQRLLVRRELPELDIDVGTVIRAVLRVTDYELNIPIPPGFFAGRPVVLASGPEGLAGYPFEEGLYDALDDVGLSPAADLGTLDAVDVDAIAGRILRQRFLRGVPRVRFYAPNASAVLRYDRAEGAVTGGGLSYGVGERQLTAYAGYAWGAGRAVAEVAVRPLPSGRGPWSLEAYLHRPVDLGARPAAAGMISSAAALAAGVDYRDLHFESGLTIGRQFGTGGASVIAISVETHSSPDTAAAATRSPIGGRALRPVLPIGDGTQLAAAWTLRSALPAPWAGRARVASRAEAGVLDGEPFVTARLDLHSSWRGGRMRAGLDADLAALYAWHGDVQHRWLIGGRSTLPGHPFHGELVDAGALASVEAWRTVIPRWLRLRAIAAVAAARPAAARVPQTPGTEPWTLAGGDPFVRGSVGLGVGLVDGILRIDYARGLGGNADRRGVVILSVDPGLWPFL